MEDINLIPEDLRTRRRKEKQARNMLYLSIIVFVLSMFFSAGSFIYKEVLKKIIFEVELQTKNEGDKIKSLEAVEGKIMVLNEKASFMLNVLNTRNYYSRLLNEIGSVLPSGIYLTDLSTFSDEKVTIGGITPSYPILANLIGNITERSKEQSSSFKYPEITSVSLKEDLNRIEFSMIIYLEEGSLRNGNAKR